MQHMTVLFLFIHLFFHVVSSKVFCMPIMVIRGHQIEVNGWAAMEVVRTISRPLAKYAFIGSIYMTIVITFERYRGTYFMRQQKILLLIVLFI